MIDVVCDYSPLSIGELRKVQLSGNGPFAVKVGHFVTDPPPLGLHDRSSHNVPSDETFEVSADEDFWQHRKGGLQIDITDAKGAKRRVHFNVQKATKGLSSSVTRA